MEKSYFPFILSSLTFLQLIAELHEFNPRLEPDGMETSALGLSFKVLPRHESPAGLLLECTSRYEVVLGYCFSTPFFWSLMRIFSKSFFLMLLNMMQTFNCFFIASVTCTGRASRRRSQWLQRTTHLSQEIGGLRRQRQMVLL